MRSQRGFTILELMIVVAIVAILASVVIPSWAKESRSGKAKSIFILLWLVGFVGAGLTAPCYGAGDLRPLRPGPYKRKRSNLLGAASRTG